jgi:hypothetical protein
MDYSLIFISFMAGAVVTMAGCAVLAYWAMKG